jgi:hypothetical protein
MYHIFRRINNIEKKISLLGDKPKGFRLIVLLADVPPLMKPIEEWITYKEQLAEYPQRIMFWADVQKELKARESYRNMTE